MKRPKRTKRGRPYRGFIRISRQRIRELSDYPRPAEVARVLGVHRSTPYDWINRGAPIEVDASPVLSGHREIRFFHKNALVEWLKNTGRYKPRQEY